MHPPARRSAHDTAESPVRARLGRFYGELTGTADFICYYNAWRPHSTLNGAVPELIHTGREWSAPPKTAKTVPAHIERRFFPETRVTGFRLAA